MWLLVVATCIAGDPAPSCASLIVGAYFPLFGDCEDAAVIVHDRLRAAADADGATILLLDTRCLPIGRQIMS
jgi:hypothetical protein